MRRVLCEGVEDVVEEGLEAAAILYVDVCCQDGVGLGVHQARHAARILRDR